LHPACVKGPGQQGAVAPEDQPAGDAGHVAGNCGHILDRRDLVEQPPFDRPVERAEVDPTRLLLSTLTGVEEVMVVRQKSWVAMRSLLARPVEGCHLCDFSALRRDPQQPNPYLPKENLSSAVPGAACYYPRRLAERCYRLACELDLLEPAVGEEADEAAVGRPEGEGRALRAGERPGVG